MSRKASRRFLSYLPSPGPNAGFRAGLGENGATMCGVSLGWGWCCGQDGKRVRHVVGLGTRVDVTRLYPSPEDSNRTWLKATVKLVLSVFYFLMSILES